jgi:hypothetical protein
MVEGRYEDGRTQAGVSLADGIEKNHRVEAA